MSMTPTFSEARRALTPAPNLPLVYFAGAHVALALAALVLVFRPDLPGPFHYHPRLIAVVHLVTLGWISASILGAFYIVAPLAFGMPFAARTADGIACAAFWLGTAGMVTGFWRADYALVGGASLAVLVAIGIVAGRAFRGLRTARMPRGVSMHVAFAFINILAAGAFGAALAVGRQFGFGAWSPLDLAAAHAHAAVLGWAVMMIIGVSYRLLPMFLPAAMPSGPGLTRSAVLLEIGTVGLVAALATHRHTLIWILVIAAAIMAFRRQVRGMIANRKPRPAEMSGRDWSTWQSHFALLYMLIAMAIGFALSTGAASASGPWVWAYGVAGLIGYVSQIIVGISGRLLPTHAWYRAMIALEGQPPPISAHRLAERRLILPIFLLWVVAVPALAIGLMSETHAVISGAALLLVIATVLQTVHMILIVRRANPRRRQQRAEVVRGIAEAEGACAIR
jgi:hypothetical protein